MKIVIIHGQSHEGSTCMAARELASKVGGEVREFFLPRDFDQPCKGCYTCFKTDLSHCPHFKSLEPLASAMLEADLLILESPVYVYHATGQMMSFLDHFGTWWVVHRPMPEMSGKQAVAISTAAGGGMKSTVRDMADSLEMWGVRRVYLPAGRGRAGGQAGGDPRQDPERHPQENRPAGPPDPAEWRWARIQWPGQAVVLHDALRPQAFSALGAGLRLLGGTGLARKETALGRTVTAWTGCPPP